MAKLNEDKLLDTLSEQPIDEQISFFEKVKAVVTTNIQAHQEQLENNATKYQNIVDKLKGIN